MKYKFLIGMNLYIYRMLWFHFELYIYEFEIKEWTILKYVLCTSVFKLFCIYIGIYKMKLIFEKDNYAYKLILRNILNKSVYNKGFIKEFVINFYTNKLWSIILKYNYSI